MDAETVANRFQEPMHSDDCKAMHVLARSLRRAAFGMELLVEIIATLEVNRNRLDEHDKAFLLGELFKISERWKARYDLIVRPEGE